MAINLDKNYWEDQYENGYTGWDVGYITTPLKEYFDQLEDKNIRILIPGCGNSYEAEYLYEKGFKNVYVLDWSEFALESFKKRKPDFPQENLICGDFFMHNKTYDLIIEQTFFCAIHRNLRPNYAKKVYNLLNDCGKLVGLLFNYEFRTENENGEINKKPPYGGSWEEYKNYFSEYFIFRAFESCRNSIKPRKDREIFINLVKKRTEH